MLKRTSALIKHVPSLSIKFSMTRPVAMTHKLNINSTVKLASGYELPLLGYGKSIHMCLLSMLMQAGNAGIVDSLSTRHGRRHVHISMTLAKTSSQVSIKREPED